MSLNSKPVNYDDLDGIYPTKSNDKSLFDCELEDNDIEYLSDDGYSIQGEHHDYVMELESSDDEVVTPPKEIIRKAKISPEIKKPLSTRIYEYKRVHHFIEHAKLQNVPLDENTLKEYFIKIEKSFNKFRSNDRKNFLNYNFVINKIMEIEGNSFRVNSLKSSLKLSHHENIWNKMEEDMDL